MAFPTIFSSRKQRVKCIWFSIFLTIGVYSLGLNILSRWNVWFWSRWEDESGNGIAHVHWLWPKEVKIFSLGASISHNTLWNYWFSILWSIGHGSQKSTSAKASSTVHLNGTRPDYYGNLGTPRPNPTCFIFKPNDTQPLNSFLQRYRTVYGWPSIFTSAIFFCHGFYLQFSDARTSQRTEPKYFQAVSKNSWDANET